MMKKFIDTNEFLDNYGDKVVVRYFPNCEAVTMTIKEETIINGEATIAFGKEHAAELRKIADFLEGKR